MHDGFEQIEQHKLEWNVSSKVGSLDNAAHKAGGGTKKVWSGCHDNPVFTSTRKYYFIVSS